FVPSTNEDLERMEVVLGPGAALYGPNTADGVLHMMTKSPLSNPGTSISVAGGEQSFLEVAGRTAIRASDSFGIKVSGLYMQAEEWDYIDPIEAQEVENYRAGPQAATFRDQLINALGGDVAAADARIARIGTRDLDVDRWSVDARADWVPTAGVNTILGFGMTNAGSGIALAGLGAGQVDDGPAAYYPMLTGRDGLFGEGYLNAE